MTQKTTKYTPHQASRLRKRRFELGYEDAARAARERGWNKRTYQAHEAGSKDIGINYLIDYAQSYGLSLDYLVLGKKPENASGVEQPPSSYRFVPLLSANDVWRVRKKSELLAVEASEKIAIPVNNDLSVGIVAVTARDDAMVEPMFNPSTNIRSGEQVIIDVEAELSPGNTVVAVLFSPTRIVIRKYALIRYPDTLDGERRMTIGLKALSPYFPEEIIESPEEGFVAGRVVRVQSVRSF